MKVWMIMIACVLFGVLEIASQEDTKVYTLKMYYNIEYEFNESQEVSATSVINRTNRNISLGHFSPAFSIQKNKTVHEIEISELKFDSDEEVVIFIDDGNGIEIPVSGGLNKSVFTKLRYEYQYQLIRKNKFLFSLGVSASPYFGWNKFSPNTSASFLVKSFALGNSIDLIPRISIPIWRRVVLDLNLPVEIIDVNWQKGVEENPILPESERSTITSNFDLFSKKFQFRLGIGVSI